MLQQMELMLDCNAKVYMFMIMHVYDNIVLLDSTSVTYACSNDYYYACDVDINISVIIDST